MYVPDGVELTQAEQVERVNQKQGIDYGNTRFKANPFNEQQSKETITELAKTQVTRIIWNRSLLFRCQFAISPFH